MTLTSAAVRRPAQLNEPLHGIVVAVLGNPKSKCHWRVKQLSPGDEAITFCHHPDGAAPSSTPWLQQLKVGSLVIYKRTTKSTKHPGEYVGQLVSPEPEPKENGTAFASGSDWLLSLPPEAFESPNAPEIAPESFIEAINEETAERPNLTGRSQLDQMIQGLSACLETLPDPVPGRDEAKPSAPPTVLARDSARRRIAKEAQKRDLFLGMHREQDLKGLWYLVRLKTHRLEVSRQSLEALAKRFDVLKPGEVLATETTTEENS